MKDFPRSVEYINKHISHSKKYLMDSLANAEKSKVGGSFEITPNLNPIINEQLQNFKKKLPSDIWELYNKLYGYKIDPKYDWNIRLDQIKFRSETSPYPWINIEIFDKDHQIIEIITFPIPILLVSIALQYQACVKIAESGGISSYNIESRARECNDEWTLWMCNYAYFVMYKWVNCKLPSLIPTEDRTTYHSLNPRTMINEKRLLPGYKNINLRMIPSSIPSPWNDSREMVEVSHRKRGRDGDEYETKSVIEIKDAIVSKYYYQPDGRDFSIDNDIRKLIMEQLSKIMSREKLLTVLKAVERDDWEVDGLIPCSQANGSTPTYSIFFPGNGDALEKITLKNLLWLIPIQQKGLTKLKDYYMKRRNIHGEEIDFVKDTIACVNKIGMKNYFEVIKSQKQSNPPPLKFPFYYITIASVFFKPDESGVHSFYVILTGCETRVHFTFPKLLEETMGKHAIEEFLMSPKKTITQPIKDKVIEEYNEKFETTYGPLDLTNSDDDVSDEE